MRNKLRSKKFWFSLAGALILLLNLLGFRVDAPYVNEVLNAICGVLIVVGLMDEPQSEDIIECEADSGNKEPENETECAEKLDGKEVGQSDAEYVDSVQNLLEDESDYCRE